MSLPPLTGHRALRQSLARATGAGQLPATLLFHGAPGCGKQSLALWLARLQLCSAPESGEPCGRCQSCRFALRLEHPDIHWYFPLPRPKGASSPEKLRQALEAARHERLGSLRENPLQGPRETEVRGLYLAQVMSIRQAANKRPTLGDGQVFIVGDAEYLVPQEASPEAANALLKLLEEPPGSTRFFLTSSRPESLLETIRSRSLEIYVPPLPAGEVEAFLREHAGAEGEAARGAAKRSQGSIGVALGHLEPDGAPAERSREALALLRVALSGPRDALFAAGLSQAPAGARGLLDLLEDLQQWIRDLTAVSVDGTEHVLEEGDLPFLEKAARARNLTPPMAARAIDRVERARILADANVNPQLLIASMLLDLHETFQGGPE